MKCRVCLRQRRGFGHFERRSRPPVGAVFHADWRFCSRRCQNIFHAIYEQWIRSSQNVTTPLEKLMIDPSEAERHAMRRCLHPFGNVADTIGFKKPLGEYSEDDALRVIDAIVTAYTEAVTNHHEATHFPSAFFAPVESKSMPRENESLDDLIF